jgi:YD repeat-containing protein
LLGELPNLAYERRSALIGRPPGLGVSYTFNLDSTISGLTADGETFSYTYDDFHREIGVTNPAGSTFSWSYLNNGWTGTQTGKNSSGTVWSRPPIHTIRAGN